jgi:hypothetical protein
VGANADALYRLMRACATVDVSTEQADRTFANNALSQTLRAGVPGSMRDFAIAQSSPGRWRPWEQLTEAVHRGKSTAHAALVQELFEWSAAHRAGTLSEPPSGFATHHGMPLATAGA